MPKSPSPTSAVHEPRRVLLVHEPPDGGVAEHVFQLAAGLGDHCFTVEVAGPPASTIVGRLAAIGIPHHAIPFQRSYGKPGQDMRALVALRALIQGRRFSVVHSHSSKAGVLGRIVGRAAGAGTVYSPHCFGFVGDVPRGRKLFALSVERLMGRATDAIICACEDERAEALAHGVGRSDRLITILYGTPFSPRGVDPDPDLLGLAEQGPVVATATVLRRQKRVDLFLDAIPIVWRARPDVQFAVIGNGPSQEELQAQAGHLGLTGDARFRFLPFTGPSQRYLQTLAVFVLSSDWEALPISSLEALAGGVPEVVTDVGGLSEAIDDSVGRVVPPRDPAAIAAAILDLLSDEPRRLRIASAAVSRHAARFTVERMVDETARLYRAVDGRRGSS